MLNFLWSGVFFGLVFFCIYTVPNMWFINIAEFPLLEKKGKHGDVGMII